MMESARDGDAAMGGALRTTASGGGVVIFTLSRAARSSSWSIVPLLSVSNSSKAASSDFASSRNFPKKSVSRSRDFLRIRFDPASISAPLAVTSFLAESAASDMALS